MTVDLFNDNAKDSSRSLQCYLVLIGYAARRQTITYSELAKKLGYKKRATGTGIMDDRLAALMSWCKHNDLPALTSLVVREDTGVPGPGIQMNRSEVPTAHAKAYAFDWYAIFPPTVAQLEKAVRSR